MTTQPPTPESAEPAPVATDTAGPVCKRCNDTHRREGHNGTMNCTSCPVPCQKCRKGGIGAYCEKPRCLCECHRKPATPAPAGDAEVSHEQARSLINDMPRGWRPDVVRYISQQDARQRQAEKRIAEYKASEADWRERLRAAQSALQGKDEVIAELKSHLLELGPDLDQANAQRDELSRKLEAAEKEVAELRASRDHYREDRRFERVKAADAEIALTEERSLTAELREQLAHVTELDAYARRLGTQLDIPSELPGLDEDHVHFVMMPIGPAARRAAVAWMKQQHGELQPAKGDSGV